MVNASDCINLCEIIESQLDKLISDKKPNLNPDSPPEFHNKIYPCICGARDYIDDKGIHMTSVVACQNQEGWFFVTCVNCHRVSTILSSSLNGAIEKWNEETRELLINKSENLLK